MAVREFLEKPSPDQIDTNLVNAGVYVIEPFVSYFIPDGRRCDMTDLIKNLLESGRKVVGFPIMEYWLDIGQRTDYDRANEDVRLGRL